MFIEENEQNTHICVVGRIMDGLEQAYRELEGKHGDHVEKQNSEDEEGCNCGSLQGYRCNV